MIGEDNVVMCDISEEAIRLAKKNAEHNLVGKVNIVQSNGFEHIKENDFIIILSNPPYHTDISVAKSFIENSFIRLILGGRVLMVTKRFDWYKNKITSVFGGCKVIEKDGYFVFVAEKRSDKKPVKKKIQQHLSKKLERKKRKQT